MTSERRTRDSVAVPNLFTATDVGEILRERGWTPSEGFSPELELWCERAAGMLGSHAADRAALGELLDLIFCYDAEKVLQRVESHAVLARYGAREVVRKVALLLLDGGALDSERFKEIINIMKEGSDLRSRDLFHPIRLALAGRAGEGELDRVILLIDEAALLPFTVAVKPARARILEFCSALD
jgi:nondiscriminating glutamyl-tRNA synthetase